LLLAFVAASGFALLGGLVALVAVAAVKPGIRALAAGTVTGGGGTDSEEEKGARPPLRSQT